MASVLFDESDFEADFGTGKGDEEEQYEEEAPCLRSDCVAAREDLDRLTSAAPTTIRLRILRFSEWFFGGNLYKGENLAVDRKLKQYTSQLPFPVHNGTDFLTKVAL